MSKCENSFMEKRQYIIPLTEVASVNMSATVLTGSPTDTLPLTPPGPAGASKRRTEVF